MDTLRVAFLSEDYFTLASSRPDIGAALALGSNVIVVGDQVAYEIVDESEAGDRMVLPEPFSPEEEGESLAPESINLPQREDPDQRDKSFSIPCLGSSFLILLPFFVILRMKNPKKE